MARSVEAIQKEIQSLSAQEQGELLAVLLEQLDGPIDEGAEAAWLAEVERRADEIDSGKVKCIPGEEVRAKIDAMLRR